MRKQLLIVFTLILSICLLNPFNNVSADATTKEGDATYTFEGDTVTDTQVGDENFNITGLNGACVDDSPSIDTRSWFHGSNDITYINFTEPHREVFFWNNVTSRNDDLDFDFYNDDDEIILHLVYEWDTNDIVGYDHENSGTIIDTAFGGAYWSFFRITMNESDDVYYQHWSTLAWTNSTDTPRYIRDNYNISYIKVHSSTSININFDNFGYNDNVLGSEEGFDDSDYASICANPIGGYINIPYNRYIEHKTESVYTMTIHAVLLPVSIDQLNLVSDTKSDYTAYVNGHYCGNPDYIQPYGAEWALIWADLNSGAGFVINNEQIVFEFGCSKYVTFAYPYYWYGVGWYGSGTGDTRGHSVLALYGDGLIGGGNTYVPESMTLPVCWYYDSGGIGQPEPIPSVDIIDQYEDSYAENGTMGWIEFYEWFSDCFHRVGDNPYIIYNLTGNTSGGAKIYRMDIIKVGDTNAFVYTGLITVTTSYKTAYFRIPDYTFSAKGQYYIKLYNTSDYGLTYDDLVYTSRNIYVCPSSDTIPGVGDGTGVLPTLDTGLGWIVGLIVTIFLTLSPMIVSGSLGGNIQVPPILYAVMGALGVSISAGFGWFPSYIFFFIVAVGIIMIVAMYMFKIRGQEG